MIVFYEANGRRNPRLRVEFTIDQARALRNLSQSEGWSPDEASALALVDRAWLSCEASAQLAADEEGTREVVR